MTGYIYHQYGESTFDSDSDNSLELNQKIETQSDTEYHAKTSPQSSPGPIDRETAPSSDIVEAPKRWNAINRVPLKTVDFNSPLSSEPESEPKTKKSKTKTVMRKSKNEVRIRRRSPNVDKEPKPKPKPKSKKDSKPITKVAKREPKKRARRTELELLLMDARIYREMFEHRGNKD